MCQASRLAALLIRGGGQGGLPLCTGPRRPAEAAGGGALLWESGGEPGLTNGEHDSVRQLHVADADPWDEANEPGHHIGVVDIDGLGDGLEAVEQGLRVLEKEGALARLRRRE